MPRMHSQLIFFAKCNEEVNHMPRMHSQLIFFAKRNDEEIINAKNAQSIIDFYH